MRAFTTTFTSLEMRRNLGDGLWQIWAKPLAGMYRPAELLAYHGKASEAIEAAERITIEHYGNMIGVEFRCVTKTTTVHTNAALNDGWSDT